MELGSVIRIRGAAVAYALAIACSGAEPARIERVDPPRVLNDRTVAVTLIGRNLDLVVEEQSGELAQTPWTVEVAGRPLFSVKWISAERLEAVVVPGLPVGTHDVIARTRGREAILRGGLAVVLPVAPRLDAIEPSRIPADTGGTVRLLGAGLHLGTRVLLGGRDVQVTWLTDQELEVPVPPGAPGPIAVEVITPVGRAVRERLLSYDPR